jgi:50S ribosomal protein L16 3-hydroxylase
MLYLPPHCAHDGVALEACTTYSIGFRAPSHEELAQAFLDDVRDRVRIAGRYTDAGIAPTGTPARLDPALLRRMAAPLARIRWSRQDVEAFLGRYLSEPKPHVTFSPPARPLGLRAFTARATRAGVRLDPATQLLYDARRLHLNGETLAAPRTARRLLERLADARTLDGASLARGDAGLWQLLHRWHEHGYLHIGAG